MKNLVTNDVFFRIVQLAQKAGEAILEVYEGDHGVEYKDDKSPLTLADKAAHEVICAGLKDLTPDVPLLSEEGKGIAYEDRSQWEYFWLVDPLDGTKEFIKRNGEFTVNIAYIHKGVPIAGVIYIPVKGITYFAYQGQGSYKVETDADLKESQTLEELKEKGSRLPLKVSRDIYTVVGSRSHLSAETEEYIEKLKEQYQDVTMISSGSSLKFCLVAEGLADVYPRFAPTMEWDTGAGQIIAQEAGASVVDTTTKEILKYNKENLLNPWFIVKK